MVAFLIASCLIVVVSALTFLAGFVQGRRWVWRAERDYWNHADENEHGGSR